MRNTVSILCVVLMACVSCTKSQGSAEKAPENEAVAAQGKSSPHGAGIAEKLPPLPNGEIEGKLVISDELASKVKVGEPIFLIARNAATGGTIAVARLTVPEKFPLPFKLTGANVMIPGRSLAGKVRVLARVDKDGEALTKNPGDVVGEVKELVQVPAKDVVLTLDTML